VKVYAQPVIALDMFPTALAAAGVETPKGVKFDGVNLIPHLTGAATDPSPPPHMALFWRYGGQWAVRAGDHKLLRASANSPVELYDLSKDVAEQKNIASEDPETLKALQQQFDEWNAQLEKPRWKDTRMERKASREAAGKGGKGGGKQKAKTQDAADAE
jgi:arylsulfatase A-like enzyme